MGTTTLDLKIKGMRKPQDFIVYPISNDQAGKPITIQSDTRFGYLDLSSGRGLMSQSHANGAYSYHFATDKKVPFKISETDVQKIKEHLASKASSKAGNSVIFSDNSGADKMAKGGKVGIKEYKIYPMKPTGVKGMITDDYDNMETFVGTEDEAVARAKEMANSNPNFVRVEVKLRLKTKTNTVAIVDGQNNQYAKGGEISASEFDKLKKDDKIKISFADSIYGSSEKELLVKSKNLVGKGKSWESEKITFQNTSNPNGVKWFAYKRKDGNVGFAIGDMAIWDVKIKD